MSVIPQVKCRRCGESFSALRSRCPNCGTRRVTQSGRTPAPTSSQVKGTAAYERANNTVITTPSPTPVNTAPTVEPPPTPTPTPTPTVEGINIQCFGTDVKDEFTMSLSRDPKIELQARVLPMEIFTAENTHITWKSSDESLFIVTPNEDTTKCTIEMLQTSTTPGTLTVSCNGYDVKLTVRLVG